MPEMYKNIKEFMEKNVYSDPEAPSRTAVSSASGSVIVIRGQYLNGTQDVDELISRGKEIVEKGLYGLKVDEMR